MPLPFSTSYMEVPPVQFNPGQPPFLPQIPVPGNVQHLVPYLASGIANELTHKVSMNAARLFTYNMVASNMWQNPAYAELIGLAAAILDINCREGVYMSPEQGMENTIVQAVSFYVSKNIFEYPELKSLCAPQVVNGAQQNIQALNNMMGKMNMMRSGGYPQQMMPQQRGMWPQQQPQQLNTFHYNFGPGQGQGQRLFSRYDNGAPSQPASLTREYHSAAPSLTHPSEGSAVDQSRYFQSRSFEPKVDTAPVRVQTEVLLNAPVQCSEEDWVPTASQPYRALVDKRTYRKVYAKQNQGVVEIIEPIKEEDMDRAKHTIQLLGDTYPLDGVVRARGLGSDVDTLAGITSADFEAKAQKELPVERVEQMDVLVHENIHMDTFLDRAIFECRMTHERDKRQGVKNNVYRCFSVIAQPFITKENHRSLLASMSNSTTFVSVAQSLKALGQSAKSIQDADPERDTTEMVFFLEAINQELTRRINRFLTKNLSLTVTIDNFVEDIGDLRSYLMKKYSQQYASAFDQFEFRVLRTLLKPIDEDSEAQLEVELNNGDEPLTFSFLPVTYSLTYLDVLAEELSIDVSDGEVLMIKENISPMLFKVAESLYKHASSFGVTPAEDLLITLDGKIFKLYRGYLGSDCYLISK